MNRPKPRQTAKAVNTRLELIATAKQLFAAQGYYNTGTHEIVAAANVTRGALQYHFPTKRELFVAVYESTRDDLKRLGAESTDSLGGSNGWERLVGNIDNLLRTVEASAFQRILFQDGPAVLGWEERREIEARYGSERTRLAVEEGIAGGLIEPQPLWALSSLVQSLLSEAIVLAANAEDRAAATPDIAKALKTLLMKLR